MKKLYRELLKLVLILTVIISILEIIKINVDTKSIKYNNKSYKIIQIDGGDMSGTRQANVAVDIGYGSRVYWGITNEYGQLIYVIADKIILQDSKTEKVLSNGRYYNDEADVLGTQRKDMDKGHVIADSMGGVSNAYNITPQDSTLNRHGEQEYLEKIIRDVGGCTNFVATITYPNMKTQIPSHYHYTYKLKGKNITDDFDNINPDKVNSNKSNRNNTHDINAIDKNHNGKVSIAEAKDAGFKMPISKSDWLYQYMDDKDGDGLVGK